MTIDPFIDLAARGALATLMLTTALHKLRDMPGFAEVVADYRLVPVRALPAVVPLVPLAEGAAAIATLFLGSPGLFAIAGLLLLYAGSIAINLKRGRRTIDCGCLAFGKTGMPIHVRMVVRNTVLAVMALVIATADTGERPLLWLDWFGLACAVVTAGLLYAIMEAAATTARGIRL